MYPPYPYPYQYPPVAVAPPPPTTPKGITWCVRALTLYPISLVLTTVAGLVALTLLGSLSGNSFIAFLPVLALLAAGGVIALVALIFYLVGFYYAYKGRNELGPAHARNVRLALYLFILGIVLGVTSGAVVSVLSFLAFRFDFLTGNVTFDAGLFYLTQAVSIGFGIAVAACVAAHLVLMIRALAKPQDERLLYAAAAIGTATPGIAGAVTILFLPAYLARLAGGGTSLGPVGPETGIPSVVSAILTLVAILLFLIVFRGAEGRLRSGELKATVPPPPAMSWMPGPVMPYAPYPSAPQVPPATQPAERPPTPPAYP